MKKITSKILFGLLVICTTQSACSSSNKKDEEQTKSNAEILQEVKEIKAIGKVVSASEGAIISTTTPSKITQIYVKEGDSVSKGQILIRLDQGNTTLDIQQAKAQLNTLSAENNVLQQDIRKAELLENEFEQKYLTSKRLFDRQAETKEKLDTDYSNWQQQIAVTRGLKQKLKAQQLSAREKQIDVQKTQNQLSDFAIQAPFTGIITDFNAKVGQSVSSNDELGKIIDITNPLVEAEVDELFVNDVKIGQEVIIYPVGRKDQVTKGKINYLSPILSNKSILYETANEGQDRRVRKIKIELTANNNLTINSKVDCIIIK